MVRVDKCCLCRQSVVWLEQRVHGGDPHLRLPRGRGGENTWRRRPSLQRPGLAKVWVSTLTEQCMYICIYIYMSLDSVACQQLKIIKPESRAVCVCMSLDSLAFQQLIIKPESRAVYVCMSLDSMACQQLKIIKTRIRTIRQKHAPPNMVNEYMIQDILKTFFVRLYFILHIEHNNYDLEFCFCKDNKIVVLTEIL